MTDKKLIDHFDIRQSKNYADYLRSQKWIVERIDNTNYFIKRLPLIGSVLKLQRPNKIDFETIKKLENKYRVFKTIIEPNNYKEIDKLHINKYRISSSPFLPSATLFLNLKQPISSITANFKKDCRYAIKKGREVSIKEYSKPDEIEKFYVAWKNSVPSMRYVPSVRNLISLKKSFPQSHSLLVASHNKFSRIIGGALFTLVSHSNQTISNYMYAFADKEGRSSLSPYSLLYYGILWAKSNGADTFDFEGVYDQRFPFPAWKGFTHFKKSFGGKESLYPGCYFRYRLPI